MQDSDSGVVGGERIANRPSGERWKSMPDGNAKRAAYLEQAREHARQSRRSAEVTRSRPRERAIPG